MSRTLNSNYELMPLGERGLTLNACNIYFRLLDFYKEREAIEAVIAIIKRPPECQFQAILFVGPSMYQGCGIGWAQYD